VTTCDAYVAAYGKIGGVLPDYRNGGCA
jgi:hypothetical protein